MSASARTRDGSPSPAARGPEPSTVRSLWPFTPLRHRWLDALVDERPQRSGGCAYGIDIADLDGNGSLDVVRIAGFGDHFVVESWVR